MSISTNDSQTLADISSRNVSQQQSQVSDPFLQSVGNFVLVHSRPATSRIRSPRSSRSPTDHPPSQRSRSPANNGCRQKHGPAGSNFMGRETRRPGIVESGRPPTGGPVRSDRKEQRSSQVSRFFGPRSITGRTELFRTQALAGGGPA
jgi:hypothetical protein